jgi:hypothetical protein
MPRRRHLPGILASALATAAALTTSLASAATPSTGLAPTTLPLPTAAPPPGPTSPPTSTVPLPDVGISTLPPTTVPTTAAPVPLTFTESSPPLGIPMEVGGGPQYVPTVLLPPAAQHGFLMLGDYRSNPGAVSQVVAYTAPAEQPSAWAQSGFTGEEQPTSVRDAVNLPDGTALVVGSIDQAAGPTATAWVYSEGSFSAPVTVGPTDSLSRLTKASVTADGTVYAVLERYVARQFVRFELATRAVDGTWSVARILPPAENVGIYGIAVVGSTIVLTGDRANVDGTTFDAGVFTSIDGGATFQLADLTPYLGRGQSTYVSDVIAGGAGFVAAACLAGPGAPRSAILQSADGLAWSEYSFTGPGGFPMIGAGCGDIAVDPEGGIWLGGAHTFDATIYRVFNGAVDRVAELAVAGQQGPILVPESIRFAVDGTTVAYSVPQIGGTAAGFVPAASATVADLFEMTPVGDAPPSHEIIRDLEVINDLGSVIGVNTFPYIVEETASYLRRTFPFTLSALGEPAPAPDAAPKDPTSGAYLPGIVSLADGGDVALADVVDPPDVAGVGTLGDIVVSRRPPGGMWSPIETVASGVGAQYVNDVTVVGGLVVGVGQDVVTNQATGIDEGRAIVLFGDGTSFSRIDLDVGGSVLAQALDVCAMPDNRALVVGYDGATGLGFSALVDLTNATAEVHDQVIDPFYAVATRCHAAVEGAIVEVAVGTGVDLYETRDGINLRRLDVTADDDSVLRVRTAAQGVAIVGVTGPGGEDAFVLFGPTIDRLQRVEIPSFAGAGVQAADDIVIGDGTLFVIGTINMSPVVWPITYQ